MFRPGQITAGLDPSKSWLKGLKRRRRRNTAAPPRSAQVPKPRRPTPVTEEGAAVRQRLA